VERRLREPVKVEFEPALLKSEELQLATVGRKTGLESSRPVWFVQRDEALYLIPGDGRQSQWYKNALQANTVRLSAGDTTQSASVKPVTDPDEVARVTNAFREKYGVRQMAALYPKCEVALEVRALA
jgi:deazaflavin-dependent oxidoreductase (nitroreductase family)